MLILDNSIVIKWFFKNEIGHEKALQIRDLAVKNPMDFAAPELLYAELVHVLSRKSGNDPVFVKQCLEVFRRIQIRILPLSEKILEHVAELSCSGFSGYDATYLALAYEFHAKWLTADSSAVQKDGAKHSLLLADWS